MKVSASIIGGSILGAGGLGYWMAAPAAIATILLGASNACGCVPRLSDHSDRWASCIIAHAAVDEKLDTLFGDIDQYFSDGGQTSHVEPKLTTEQAGLVTKYSASCGEFTEARSRDVQLANERKKRSFEDLVVPNTAIQALAHSASGGYYLMTKDMQRTAVKEAGDA